MPGSRWTVDERLELEALAGIKTVKQIARRLNRSYSSVESAAYRWGISTRPSFDNFSIDCLANHLGCSDTSVRRWVETGKLKAKKSNRNYQIKIDNLRDFYRRWSDDNRVLQSVDKDLLVWLLNFENEEKMAKYQTMWTHEETETLIAMAEQSPVENIARQLNRSLGSVRGKAQLMGISLRTTVDYLSTSQIAEMLGCDRGAIVYWIKKGMISARRSTRKTGQWRISRRSLKELYEQKPNLSLWKEVPQENLDWLFK